MNKKVKLFVFGAFVIFLGVLCLNLNKETGIFSIENHLKKVLAGSETDLTDIITDEQFRECILKNEQYESGNLDSITNLDCTNEGITSLKGIEKLTKLESLSITNNNLTSTKEEPIDLSNNTSLKKVSLYNNKIGGIKLENLDQLETLYIWGNELTELDLSNLSKLKTIISYDNKLTSINLDNITNLENLEVNNNELSSLNLEQCTKLSKVEANNNKLTTEGLKLSNSIVTLSLNDNSLSGELDLSNNTSIYNLSLQNNQITNINLAKNSVLKILDLRNNLIENIDLDLSKLQYLYLNNNKLVNLDVRKLPYLFRLIINDNNFKSTKTIGLYKNTEREVGEEYFLSDVVFEDADTVIQNNPVIKFTKTRKTDKGDKPITNTLVKVKSLEENLKAKYSDQKVVLNAFSVGTYHLNVTNSHSYILGNAGKDNLFDIKYDIEVVELTKKEGCNYEINEELNYVNTFNETDTNTIKNNLIVNKGGVNVTEDKVEITYNGETIKTFKLVNYKSETYDLTKDYIYVGKNSFTNDIKGSNITVEATNDNLVIKLEGTDEVLKSVPIISYSSQYNLSEDYIYVGSESFVNDIDIPNLEKLQEKGLVFSYDEDSGIIELKFKEDVLEKTYIVKYKLKNDITYKLGDGYVYVDSSEFSKDNIEVLNGKLEETTNAFVIKYGSDESTTSEEIKIVSYSFDSKYKKMGNSLYVGKINELNDSYISVVNGTKSLNNNSIEIKYNEETVDTISLIYYISNYDLTQDYINMGTDSFLLSSIEYPKDIKGLSLTYNEKDGVLTYKYNGEVLESIDVVNYKSSSYDLTKDYIYLGNKEFNSNNLKLVKAKHVIGEDDKLKIYYVNDDEGSKDPLKTYDLLKVSFGSLSVNNNIVSIPESGMLYSEFVKQINTNNDNLTYKIYNKDNEYKEDQIIDGLTLKIEYKGEVLQELLITIEYVNLENVTTEEDLITDLNVNDTLASLKNKVSTSGKIEFYDSKGNIIKNENSAIGTGYKVKITLKSEIIEYTLVVKGDVTGDASVDIQDMMEVATNIVKHNNSLQGCYERAAKVTGEEDIWIGDMMAIAKYIVKGDAL